jgi:Uma2 family endonuclease
MNLLARTLPPKFHIRSQTALRLADSVPEPDIAVVLGPPSRYDTSHPGANDAVLVVEVADSTLADDQNDKAVVYARAGLPVYWIVNLVDRRIEIYTDPTGAVKSPVYRTRRDYNEGSSVILTLPGSRKLALSVRDILPGAQ